MQFFDRKVFLVFLICVGWLPTSAAETDWCLDSKTTDGNEIATRAGQCADELVLQFKNVKKEKEAPAVNYMALYEEMGKMINKSGQSNVPVDTIAMVIKIRDRIEGDIKREQEKAAERFTTLLSIAKKVAKANKKLDSAFDAKKKVSSEIFTQAQKNIGAAISETIKSLKPFLDPNKSECQPVLKALRKLSLDIDKGLCEKDRGLDIRG